MVCCLFSHTIKRDQESFIYEDGWVSLKPSPFEWFPKRSSIPRSIVLKMKLVAVEYTGWRES